ncbi:PREDICTED: uncharacterized protein LOC109190521 [Ipomoea nil]|uniref:uncharacterized protein LOC109190521 n=1 Tax=Ipomoea nil TaxID=35883 RepID=UPI0009009668|nr:PREDICTED: uncharacterized protein LOC109190521 [Ipomoea nil]
MGVNVRRVTIDTGSSVNVLYLDVFQKLKLDPAELMPIATPLLGFTGDTIHPEGRISLPVEMGTPPRMIKTQMEFVVVNLHCGVGVLRGSVASARKCYSQAVNRRDTRSSRVKGQSKRHQKDAQAGCKEQPEPSEEIEEVPLHGDRPNQKIKIGKSSTPELRAEILFILREFADIFAWGPEDMPGIDRVMPFDLRKAGTTYQRMVNTLFEKLLAQSMEAYVDDMVMPFDLRKAGTTYQRMVNTLFEKLLAQSMVAYVDDMLVKSRD